MSQCQLGTLNQIADRSGAAVSVQRRLRNFPLSTKVYDNRPLTTSHVSSGVEGTELLAMTFKEFSAASLALVPRRL